MDIRNIQKTGKMFYLYLPTNWCKKYNINSSSKVGINISNDGSLLVYPHIKKKKLKHLSLSLSETNYDIINKVIVACFVNPAASFKITLDSEVDYKNLLDQKRLLNVELVEFDGRNIICESSISVEDPFSLLATMAKKAKNMVKIMMKDQHPELISRYEEEIDKSKLFIEKSVISSLISNEVTKLTSIDLHYIVLISKDLERMVDHMRQVNHKEKPFMQALYGLLDFLSGILEDSYHQERPQPIDYKTAITFSKKVSALPNPVNLKNYDIRRVKGSLVNISEVLLPKD